MAIGLVVSNVLAAASAMWLFRRRIGDYALRAVLVAWGRMVLAAAGAGYLAWGLVVVLTRALAGRGRLGDAVTIVLAGTLFAGVYFLLARMLQIRELERLVVPVINRLDRRPAGRHRGELAGDAPSPATQAKPPTSGDAPPPPSLPTG